VYKTTQLLILLMYIEIKGWIQYSKVQGEMKIPLPLKAVEGKKTRNTKYDHT